MDLKKCLELIVEELGDGPSYQALMDGTINPFIKHFRMGMWIRNKCDMWTIGIAEINTDIIMLNMALGKSYHIHNHPDDCSHVIMEIFIDWKKGNLGSYFGSQVDLNCSSEEFWGIC